MNKEIENIVVIDRFDYDELVEKAGATEDEIKKQAEELYMRKNIIPIKIEFSQYLNNKNFSAPVEFSRSIHKEEVYEALDKIEPHIREWMDENLSRYGKQLRDKDITEKNCIALSKRVANLEEREKTLKIKYIFAICYSVIISTIVFFLLLYLK